jgi:hypothetical protein
MRVGLLIDKMDEFVVGKRGVGVEVEGLALR